MIRLTGEDVVLFQGDSITDGNRGRNEDPNHVLGHGYACMAAARMGADNLESHPAFFNRGQSGDGILQMYARWRRDAILLRPTLVSILIGINDSGACALYDEKGGMPRARFAQAYRTLLAETREDLPGALLVLCEPFYLPLAARDADEAAKQRRVAGQIAEYQQAVRELAREFACVFVPLQDMLAERAAQTAAGYLVWDGVHPTMIGHEFIARQWLNTVERALS